MKNVPNLRFKEFSSEWESGKLGQYISNKGGTALEKYVEDEGTHNFISIGNYSVDGNYIDTGQRINLNDKTQEKLLNKNDLVMVLNDKTASGDLIGSTILIDEDNKYIYNQRSERLICNSAISPDFCWVLLNSKMFRRKVFSIAQGGTQIYVNFSNVKNLQILLPSLNEQKKIASFFSLIDKKIELQTEKVEELTNYKKGIMQKIFSQELRFKDENGNEYPEWKIGRLGEYLSNKGGTALEKYVEDEGTHNFISIGNYSVDGNYIDTGQRINLNDKTQEKLLNKNDLVMVLNDKTASGDLIGSTILIDEDNKYIYNQRSERLICNSAISPDFCWVLLNSKMFRKKVFSIAQGGTQIYVNFSSVKNLEIELPHLKEQEKIAHFIFNLNTKLNKEQEKLDMLLTYKKGLLQQMFI